MIDKITQSPAAPNFRTLMAIGRAVLIVCAIAACAIAVGQPAKAAPLARFVVAQLLQDADALLAQASAIVANVPSSSARADAIGGSSGRDFHAAERRFQDRAFPLNPPPRGTADTLDDAIVRLNQFDNFANAAVSDALTCDGRAARANLRIAREILSHAHLDFTGKLQAEWSPSLDIPDGSNGCS